MKVLHLPTNVSSQISVTVRALRSIGIDARGLAKRVSPIQDYEGIDTVDWMVKPKPWARLWRSVRWRSRLLRGLAWADFVHWHYGETTWKGLDLRAAALLRKPRLVEFWGDDLRRPNIASRDNPFIARMYAAHPELAQDHSQATQSLFQGNGFACLIPGLELNDYLDPGIYPEFHCSRVRIALEDFQPLYPDPDNSRPLLVHAPSNKLKKGTEAVFLAVEKLRQTHSFDFRLIHDLPRPEALKLVGQCDQFTIGAEGLASYEAMAAGKPVVCFVKESLRQRYPREFPIVIADQNNLDVVLSQLLNDGWRRSQLGTSGRSYVERYHDARKVAQELLATYERVARSQGAQGSAFA